MNSKKIVYWGLGLVVVALAVAALTWQNNSGTYQPGTSTTPDVSTNPASATPTPATPSAAPSSYKMSDVALHKDSSSCWTTINGDVYDLTTWIAQHPGGEQAILSICGKDGTQAFEGQHANSGRANNVLDSLKIGTLAN